MKKQISLLLIALTLGFGTIYAQERMQMTPEEKTRNAVEKLAVLNLGNDVTDKAKAVIMDYYTAQQRQLDEMRASGANPDRDLIKNKRKQLAEIRDKKLKEFFTADQFRRWKNEIEPSLIPKNAVGRD